MKRFLWGLMALGLLVGGAGHAEGQSDYLISSLDVPAGFSLAFGINNGGQIVGEYEYGGFRLSGGTLTTINVPGRYGTILTSINDFGQIVGVSEATRDSIYAAFVYDGSRSFTSITPVIPGVSFYDVYPTGINNAGTVVGIYSVDLHGTTGGSFIGSLGHYTALNVPGSIPTSTVAYAINNAGQVLVLSSLGYGLYQPSTGMYSGLSLQAFGTPNVNMSGLNDTDQIVGDYLDASGKGHGFMLTDGVLTNIDVPGALYTVPNGINDLGDIVGYYADASGNTHAFLATPVPEPSTLLLLAIAALSLIWFCWKLPP